MNARIKELADQASLYVVSDNSSMSFDVWKKRYTEKFAELIINDCVDLVKPTNHHLAFAQGYMGGVDGLELLYGKVDQIKNHFGVEE